MSANADPTAESQVGPDSTIPPNLAKEPVSPNVQDERRGRELHQYFRPPASLEADAVRLPYPDTVLQAHAQSITWRLNVQCAMVNLIDKDTQYIVAKSTRATSLDDVSIADNIMDQMRAGCVNFPKREGRLCEHTILQIPRFQGNIRTPAYFEARHLDLDERFKELPLVVLGPCFRYYCGVPLMSAAGVVIGTLFVMDTKSPEPMGVENINCEFVAARTKLSIRLTRRSSRDMREERNVTLGHHQREDETGPSHQDEQVSCRLCQSQASLSGVEEEGPPTM